MHRRGVLGFLARIALVAKAYLHGLAGYFLHLPAQLPDLRPLLLVGWGDDHAQQVAPRIDRDMALLPLRFLAPS